MFVQDYYIISKQKTRLHESANYTLRLTRSWYFMYGSLRYQFLLFQKEVVILSNSLLCVLLQNTISLRRFFLAGFFFHSFFLYPDCLRTKRRGQEVRLWFEVNPVIFAVNCKTTVNAPCVWSKGHSAASWTFQWLISHSSSLPSSRCSTSEFCLAAELDWEQVQTPWYNTKKKKNYYSKNIYFNSSSF